MASAMQTRLLVQIVGLRTPNIKNADDVSPMGSLDPMVGCTARAWSQRDDEPASRRTPAPLRHIPESGFDLSRTPTLGDVSPSYRPYCRPGPHSEQQQLPRPTPNADSTPCPHPTPSHIRQSDSLLRPALDLPPA
ncbi:hypothetical protein C8R44DRAFT_821275 [Mycena epipterygia]|nr:hypothetical protein C8R44DRAFT_821275 [Mycena epipterygia]